jgi:hypothetical protein
MKVDEPADPARFRRTQEFMGYAADGPTSTDTRMGERPSSDVDRPSRRLHTQCPAHAPLVTTRTTEHPALIPHEVPAGARRRTAIPARRGVKRPARAGNPAYPA